MTDLVVSRITTADAANLFVFAGKAIFTLRSKKTGAHFTYRVKESDDGKCHFVSVLTGSSNENDYQYLGHFRAGAYSHGRKSRISLDAPSAIAMRFFADCLYAGRLHDQLEVWHEGRCGACARRLTVPESIATGVGPECAERLGIPRAVICDEVFNTLP